MQKLLNKIKELRARVERGERKTRRVLIAGKVYIVNEEGKHATDLKQKWQIQ